MPTTRADRALPSRQVLAELPPRVVVFLHASGAHTGIRGALTRGGFTANDHREGWALLEAACAYGTEGLDPADDDPARSAAVHITEWVETHFPRLHAALARLHPEAPSLFSGVEAPPPGEAVLALATWLSRLDSLDPGSPVVTTLAGRGITAATRAELHELLRAAQVAPALDSAAPIRARREEELLALHLWFTDWSATARAVIRRKDYLIALGLAGRRRRKSGDNGARSRDQ